ncbi:membrane protein insertase YidC [Azohydromonas lata]|uniref:membrane protein insertase YidC n=1 Tax=Azohydromonas lata TaxID=45677 RepID=UPI00082D8846|nr:membrane protein insertase YidC [Azohydromonas lata]
MTDIRRTLLWVVFTMSLVLLWDAWNKHNGQPSFFGPRTTATAPAAGAGSAPPASVPAPAATATAAAPGAAPVAAAAAPAAAENVTITTDVVKATLSSLGGDLVRLELLTQADDHDPNKRVVLFDRSAERTYLAQTGLVSATGAPLPTHLTPMTVAPGARELKDGNELQVRFESAEVNGVQLVKTYTFRRGEYTVGVRHEVINRSAAPVAPQLYLQLVRDNKALPGGSSFYSTFTGPAVYTDTKKYQKVDFKDLAKGTADFEKRADSGWVAMVQHYYASAWLVNQPQPREFRSAKLAEDLYSIAMVLPLGEVAPGATKAQDTQLFAGPQEEKRLEAIAPGLELVKDYGYFAILSKPLFWLLDKLHSVLKNWGWSIIALVVLLKIAFYWLNANAYKSMAKMKAVNPRVQELRERYKSDPQKMQTEMMRIYREEKVNPLGGCLPIFIQMPFFIALYWVLLSSVEMRNAPWLGWITDLSAKDPFYILPLLMTASTLLQTWLNPTPPDPTQAKMMWIMPLVFSVMFFTFPAGLVLYWLTNNLLSIAQQYVINKRLGVTK